MKKLLLLLIMVVGLMPAVVTAGVSAIVTNVSGTGSLEDSITVAFIVTDSIGNMSSLDSIFVGIFDPNGDSVYAASYITTAAEIDSMDWGGTRTLWRWTEQIADIDASGRVGTYTGIIIAIDTLDGTGSEYLDQSAFFSFQLINAQFSSLIDSAAYAQLNQDSIRIILDSLEALESWVATTANQTLIIDSLNAILDSLQLYDARWDSTLAALSDASIGDKTWTDPGTRTITGTGTDAITAASIAADAIGVSEIAAAVYDEVWRNIDTVHVDSSDIGEWMFNNLNGASGGLDTLQTAFVDRLLTRMADSIYKSDTAAYNGIVGTYGEILAKPAYVQGTASGLSATEIMDSLRAFPVSDTATATIFAQLVRQLDLVFDSTNAYDDWIAMEVTALKSLDSLNKILDSIYTYDTKWDSVLAAVSDANMSDKIWVDGTPTIRGYLDVALSTLSTASALATMDAIIDNIFLYTNGDDVDGIDADIKAIRDSLQFLVTGGAGSGLDTLSTVFALQLARIIARENWDIAGSDDTTYGAGTMGLEGVGWDLTGTSGGVDSVVLSNVLRRIMYGLPVGSGSDSTTYSQRLVNALTTGAGAYAVTVVVYDTGSSVPVANAPVYINNVAQTGIPFSGTTDNNGSVTFQLNAATWVAFHTTPGYTQITDTIVVSASATDTLFTETSNANKTTVYGNLMDNRGIPYGGALVMFRLFAVPEDSMLTFNDTIVTQSFTFDTTNSSGFFEIPVFSNEVLSDSSYYRVTFQDQYGNYIDKYKWYVNVPDTSSINFNALGRWRK